MYEYGISEDYMFYRLGKNQPEKYVSVKYDNKNTG